MMQTFISVKHGKGRANPKELKSQIKCDKPLHFLITFPLFHSYNFQEKKKRNMHK